MLSGAELTRLLNGLLSDLPKPPDEITVEVNPGTTTEDRLDAFSKAGVHRVSMGVQSLDPDRLKLLGRIHTPEDVEQSLEELRVRGISSINLDLIYGQPRQSLEDWQADVEAALTLNPDHLSLYALQYEEGTVFTEARDRGKLQEANEGLILEMFLWAKDRLEQEDISFYEISNAAKKGMRSRHNLAYWKNLPYYGIGAGAYGYVDSLRYLNTLDPRSYIKGVEEDGTSTIEEDQISTYQTFVECLVSGLRTIKGVDLDRVADRTGYHALRTHPKHLHMIQQRDLGSLEGSRLRLNWDGLWILDSILEPFLQVEQARSPA